MLLFTCGNQSFLKKKDRFKSCNYSKIRYTVDTLDDFNFSFIIDSFTRKEIFSIGMKKIIKLLLIKKEHYIKKNWLKIQVGYLRLRKINRISENLKIFKSKIIEILIN